MDIGKFMHNLSLLEEYYQKFINNVNLMIPEGIYFINLELLYQYDLLNFQPKAGGKEPSVTRYFHIYESPEKITLINDEFIIWIAPETSDQVPRTHTLIALNQGDKEPQLEVAFIASGIYNNSRLVFKVLEKFLIEIHETEAALSKFERTGS